MSPLAAAVAAAVAWAAGCCHVDTFMTFTPHKASHTIHLGGERKHGRRVERERGGGR